MEIRNEPRSISTSAYMPRSRPPRREEALGDLLVAVRSARLACATTEARWTVTLAVRTMQHAKEAPPTRQAQHGQYFARWWPPQHRGRCRQPRPALRTRLAPASTAPRARTTIWWFWGSRTPQSGYLRQAVEAQGSPMTCFWACATVAPRRGTTPALNNAGSACITPAVRKQGAVPGHTRKHRAKQPQWLGQRGRAAPWATQTWGGRPCAGGSAAFKY